MGAVLCTFFTMNDNKSPQNRYCCVPLCSQKGSTGPNGEKVGCFSIPAEKDLREQWLHAIRRDTGKHFSVTEATKVCSLHFKKEEVKKSLGIQWTVFVRRWSSSLSFCMEEELASEETSTTSQREWKKSSIVA